MTEKRREALKTIESQLDSGYIDISEWPEEEEMSIIREAIDEWRKKHRPEIVESNDGRTDVLMHMICGCDRCSGHDNWTLSDCEKYCDKYYSCDNVAIANDILKDYEEGE